MALAIRTATRVQDQDDVNVTLGAGVDEYALAWDNDTAKFVLRAPFAGLLATGATVGATAQAQAFTNGITGPLATLTATADAELSAEYITAATNRDFSAAPDWAGTNWLRPLLAVAQANDITVAAVGKTFTRTAGSFVADGFQVGMSVTWSGFAKAGTLNNGTFVISAVSALVMTCSTATLSDEVPADYTACSATSPVFSHAVAGANAATLANTYLTAAPVSGNIYQITITVQTVVANTLTISIGGVAMAAVIGKATGALTAYVFNIAAASAGVLTVTPGATWLGWIDDVSVKLVIPAASVLTGKTVDGTTVLETRMPNSTSIGLGTGALQGCVQLYSNGLGYAALQNNTGSYSNGLGYAALQNNTGSYSNGFGNSALRNNTGLQCNGLGYAALQNNTGLYSNGFGNTALQNNTGAFSNSFGSQALQNNTGMQSNGFGHAALYSNAGAYSNGFGHAALQNNTGSYSNGFGFQVLYENTSGAGNSAFGHNAGRGFSDNSYCVFLGYDTRTAVGTLTNSIVIGANARGTKSNQVTLGHTDIVETVLRGQVLQNHTSAVTNAVTDVLTLGHDSSGTPAAGFGAGQLFTLKSSTTLAQNAARIQALWYEATHATRKADLILSAYDTSEREGLRIRGNGSAPAIGFYGVTPIARAVLATGAGATVDNVITALQNLGLVKQS